MSGVSKHWTCHAKDAIAPTTDNYYGWLVSQLRMECSFRGIKVKKGDRKHDMVEALKESDCVNDIEEERATVPVLPNDNAGTKMREQSMASLAQKHLLLLVVVVHSLDSESNVIPYMFYSVHPILRCSNTFAAFLLFVCVSKISIEDIQNRSILGRVFFATSVYLLSWYTCLGLTPDVSDSYALSLYIYDIS
jgi:hypothetical protein